MNETLFTVDNMLMGESVAAEDLFGEDISPQEETQQEESKDTQEEKVENNIPEGEVDAEDLFGTADDDNPESVGDDKDKEEKETFTNENDGSSPKSTNLYSSFAHALYGDGLFQTLDDETINKVKDADSFSEAFENEINARLDETQRRIKEALDYGVQPNIIGQYERTLSNLNGIKEENLTAETDEGENLRKIIIKQDFINRGFSAERAERQAERSLNAGTDIEDAKDALESVKDFFQNKYDEAIKSAKEEAEAESKRIEKEAEEFKKNVLEKDTLFDDIPIDKKTRQKAFEAMTKIVKTTSDGEKLTAVQQYADENPVQFRTLLGVMYAMTDGFKKMGNILNSSVKKRVKTNLQNIERQVYGNQHQGGSFRLAEGEDYQDAGLTRRKRLDI